MTDQNLEKMFPFLKKRKQVISIVGAGGKTTLMYALARYYAGQGASVVVTTTTHIKRPQNYLVARNKEELLCLLAKNSIVAAGAAVPENKLTQAYEMSIIDYMNAADIVLVEADGAKHYPCKVPSDTEPVIPKESGIVLGVMGMDAVGRPLNEVCFRKEKAIQMLRQAYFHKEKTVHMPEETCIRKEKAVHTPEETCIRKEKAVHMPEETCICKEKAVHMQDDACTHKEKAAQMPEIEEDHCMTQEDLAEILSSDWGTRKNVGDADYYIVLNKCDNELRRQHGQRIQSLLAQDGLYAVCVSLLYDRPIAFS